MLKIKVSKRDIKVFLLLFAIFVVLSLPGGIRDMTSIYKMSTEDIPLIFTYNYYFTIFEIPIILYGLYLYRHSKVIRFLPIYIGILLLNILYAILGMENIFDLQSYEMFLLLATGFSAASIVLYYCKTLTEINKVYDMFILLNFVFQIVNAIVNGVSDGRISTLGMGEGATASIYSFYVIWCLFARRGDIRYIPLGIAFLGMVMTGSRANLLTTILVCVVFIYRLIKHQRKVKSKINILYIIGIAVFIGLIVIAVIMLSDNSNIFSRYLELFQGSFVENVSSDSSVEGRIRSILGGIEILKENILGLPFSMYAIERASYLGFTMEYPHSTFLCMFILWSPIFAIICIGYLIRLLYRLIKKKDSAYVLVLYYLIMGFIYGSPVLYAKTWLFLFLWLTYVKMCADTDRKMTKIK